MGGMGSMGTYAPSLTIPLYPGLYPEQASMGPEDQRKFLDSYDGNIDTLQVRSCQHAGIDQVKGAQVHQGE